MGAEATTYKLMGQRPPQGGEGGRRLPFSLTLSEGWLTVALLAFILLVTAWSVEQARWVPNMPPISLTIILGAGLGMVLAKIRTSPFMLQPLGVLVGFGWTSSLVSRAVTEGDTVSKFGELFQRLGLFIQIAKKGDISVDILPFIFILVLLAWFIGYFSAWFIFRSHNIWAGIIPSGLAIITNLSYLPEQFAGYFFFYLLGGMLLVMRLHVVNKRREWETYQVRYPKWVGAFILNDAFWISIIILIIAWQLPARYVVIDPLRDAWITVRSPIERVETELGRLFSTLPSKKPLPMYTFGRTLPFRGSVVLGQQLAFTVESTSGGYWKAKSYSDYTLQGWVASEAETHPLGWEPKDSLKRDYKKRREIAQKVSLSIPTTLLFAAGDIRKANVEANVQVLVPPGSSRAAPNPPDIVAVEVARQLRPASVYEVVSSRSAASASELRSASSNYPAWVKNRYLQLPESLPERVKRLARDITKDTSTSYDKAIAIEGYLRKIPYSLDIEPPGFRSDGVDHFIFDLGRGYSDYYASAMSVMLRAVGVPARVAVGYNQGQRETKGNVFVVKENNAHAWPEVFFPEYGWVEFEPSPVLPSIARGEEGEGGEGSETQLPLDEEIGLPDIDLFEEENFFPLPPVDTGFSVTKYVRPVGYSMLGIILLLLIALVAWRLSFIRIAPSSRPYLGMLRLAGFARRGMKPQQTPHEYAETLSEALPPHSAEIRTITNSYVKTRYGNKPLTAEEEQGVQQAWAKLRLGLLGLLVRRRKE